MMGAYHPMLANAKWDQQSTIQRAPDFHNYDKIRKKRIQGPGAGAFTSYYDVQVKATKLVHPGEEIFLDFGDAWEEEQQQEKSADGESSESEETKEYTHNDFKMAQRKLDDIIKFIDGHRQEIESTGVADDLWAYLKSIIIHEHSRNLLPNDFSEFEELKKYGVLLYNNKQNIRSTEWLEKNGRCMDNIVIGKSKLPSAGRGAYATRSFKKGDLITSTPLLHILDKKLMEMYSRKEGKIEDQGEKTKTVKGYQLLLNYCYGQNDSPMLLLPLNTGVNLINHSSEKPNVKLSWSRTFDLFQEEYLEKEVSALEGVMDPVLYFDILALEDIKDGDELYLDYGSEWETAWNKHVKKYEADPGFLHNKNYVSAVYMNHKAKTNKKKEKFHFRTEEEQVESPYPANILTVCYISDAVLAEDILEIGEESSFLSTEHAKHYIDWEEFPDTFDGDSLKSCTIIERLSKNEKEENHHDEKMSRSINEYNVLISFDQDLLITNVPQDAILFADKPYTSEQHWKGSFRHHIGLMDIFPEKWKDIIKS